MTTPFRFEGISLPVTDVATSVTFYRSLGFTVEQQHDVFALLRLGSGTIGLLRTKLDTWPRNTRRNIHIELTTDDLDQLYADLTAQGIEFYAPPHDRPWERAMSAYDPDGYTVEWAQGHRGHNQPGAEPSTKFAIRTYAIRSCSVVSPPLFLIIPLAEFTNKS